MLERLRQARRFLTETEETFAAAPARGVPSLAREVVIASTNPANGKIWNNAAYAMPAALLLELAHEGRVDVTGTGRKTRVTLRDATPLGDPELDDAMRLIGSGVLGCEVKRLCESVPQTRQLLARLVAEGIVTEETHRLLGLFTVHRYYPTPAAGRDEIVARLRSALLGESVPDERTALLVSSLVDVHWQLFVPRKQVSEAYRRSPEIREQLRDDKRAILEAVDYACTENGADSSSV